MFSILQWPFSEHVVLPLYEHLASVSDVGLPTKIYFVIGHTAKGNSHGVSIKHFTEHVCTEEVCVSTKLRKILPTQILILKGKGGVNHNTFQWCFLLARLGSGV